MKKLIILFIILLIIGAYLIKTNYNLNIKSKEDQKTFLKLFTSWVSILFDNIRDITSLVIQKEWLPETNQTKK